MQSQFSMDIIIFQALFFLNFNLLQGDTVPLSWDGITYQTLTYQITLSNKFRNNTISTKLC